LSEIAGVARMHTCLDQYNANKVAEANGGLHWIQIGGGYYTQCNERLKGSVPPPLPVPTAPLPSGGTACQRFPNLC
jgi:hypothetical protein